MSLTIHKMSLTPDLTETDRPTWQFAVDGGYPYTAPHAAKSRIAEENDDVDYDDLVARMFELWSNEYAVVVIEK